MAATTAKSPRRVETVSKLPPQPAMNVFSGVHLVPSNRSTMRVGPPELVARSTIVTGCWGDSADPDDVVAVML